MSTDPKWDTPEWHRAHAVYGTTFEKKPSATLNEIRQDLSRIRGKISDISFGHPTLKEALDKAEGTLTLVISYLYSEMEEMKANGYDKWPISDSDVDNSPKTD